MENCGKIIKELYDLIRNMFLKLFAILTLFLFGNPLEGYAKFLQQQYSKRQINKLFFDDPMLFILFNTPHWN